MTKHVSSQRKQRVEREKEAHEHKDILGENLRLKENYFSHTKENIYFKQFNNLPYSLISSKKNIFILELGSGYGDRSIKLAQDGASVTGIDISEVYIASAISKAKKLFIPEEKLLFKTMDCHCLDFSNNYFDLVCGNAILHHLDIDIVLEEIKRVLKPGGIAVFIEPLEGNPLLKIFRYFTPDARTIDEKPLSKNDLKKIAKYWMVLSEYYGIICAPVSALTSLMHIKNPNNILVKLAAILENRVNTLSFFHSYNQYVFLHLVKK